MGNQPFRHNLLFPTNPCHSSLGSAHIRHIHTDTHIQTPGVTQLLLALSCFVSTSIHTDCSTIWRPPLFGAWGGSPHRPVTLCPCKLPPIKKWVMTLRGKMAEVPESIPCFRWREGEAGLCTLPLAQPQRLPLSECCHFSQSALQAPLFSGGKRNSSKTSLG